MLQVDEERNSIIQTQTIVTLSKLITAKAIQQCLMFIYTGTIEKEYLELQVISVPESYFILSLYHKFPSLALHFKTFYHLFFAKLTKCDET